MQPLSISGAGPDCGQTNRCGVLGIVVERPIFWLCNWGKRPLRCSSLFCSEDSREATSQKRSYTVCTVDGIWEITYELRTNYVNLIDVGFDVDSCDRSHPEHGLLDVLNLARGVLVGERDHEQAAS
jgi:hypothetical protein